LPSQLTKLTILCGGISTLVAGPAKVAGAASHSSSHVGRSVPAVGGTFIRTNGDGALPLQGGSVTRRNGAGYAITPPSGNITGVSSTFTVPTAGLILPAFSASWTGIGGYSSTDLIQAGVAEDSLPNNPLLGDQYYAWYELLPGAAEQLTGCTGDASCAVSAGDSVSVNIFQTAANVWTVDVADSGRWTWTSTGTGDASSHSSAEWILEAPRSTGCRV
jgi:hypothetical protein